MSVSARRSKVYFAEDTCSPQGHTALRRAGQLLGVEGIPQQDLSELPVNQQRLLFEEALRLLVQSPGRIHNGAIEGGVGTTRKLEGMAPSLEELERLRGNIAPRIYEVVCQLRDMITDRLVRTIYPDYDEDFEAHVQVAIENLADILLDFIEGDGNVISVPSREDHPRILQILRQSPENLKVQSCRESLVVADSIEPCVLHLVITDPTESEDIVINFRDSTEITRQVFERISPMDLRLLCTYGAITNIREGNDHRDWIGMAESILREIQSSSDDDLQNLFHFN